MNALKESERLATLDDYQLLDTPPEVHLNDLTQLASEICQTPIALICLLDEHRQWFKSSTGIDVTEAPRQHAFCDHAIQLESLMTVEDAHQDQRFSNNPLVTGYPNIRFYAGAPLQVANGHRLGTLCVIDTKPRQLSATQRRALEVLRDAVVTHLELRKVGPWPGDVLHVCAWCKKVRAFGKWQIPGSLLESRESVSHGICPDCQTEIFKDIHEPSNDP